VRTKYESIPTTSRCTELATLILLPPSLLCSCSKKKQEEYMRVSPVMVEAMLKEFFSGADDI